MHEIDINVVCLYRHRKKITLCVNWAVPAVFILSKWCHAMSCFAPLKNLVLTDCPHVHLMERCFAPLKNDRANQGLCFIRTVYRSHWLARSFFYFSYLLPMGRSPDWYHGGTCESMLSVCSVWSDLSDLWLNTSNRPGPVNAPKFGLGGWADPFDPLLGLSPGWSKSNH